MTHWPTRLVALCLGWTAAQAAAGSGALAASPMAAAPMQRPGPGVTCEVDYGGELRRLPAPATDDPLAVPATEVGSYFLFRVVNTLGSGVLPSVKVYVYANHDRGPAMLHQGTYTPVTVAAASPDFTGWQRVYEPVRDGELTYRCLLDRPAPARRLATEPRRAAPAPQPPVVEAHAPSLNRPTLPTQPTQRTEPSQAAHAATPGTVRLVMVGDLMLDDGPGQTIAQGGDPLAPFAPYLRDADYTIGNLELPIARTGQPLESKIYSFRADPSVVRVLKGRFDALALANNHSGDQGVAALLETMRHLDDAGIAHVGAGRNLHEAHRPLWIRRNGLSIAVLSYNEFKPRSFQAGPTWPGIAWSEDDLVIRDMRAARAAGADIVIPFLHWGWERERTPSARQQALARLLIDHGADVVVGGHPHVTQGLDVYRNRLVVYSLGNFVFDSFDEVPGGTTGWLLRLTLTAKGLQSFSIVPALIDPQGTPHPSAMP